MSMPSISMLKETDSHIRVVIKRILHLHMSTADGLIYVAKRDGGLGMLRLAQHVPRVALNLGLRLSKSLDSVCNLLSSCPCFSQRIIKTAKAIRINVPYTENDLKTLKKKWSDEEIAAWERLGSQGKAVRTYQ